MNLNRKYLTISAYTLLGAIIVVTFTACVYRFSSVLSLLKTLFEALKPVIYGIAIALAVNPMYTTLHNRLFGFVTRKKALYGLRKALSLTLTYLILITVLIALLAAVLPQLISSCEEIAAKSTAYLSSALDWLDQRLSVFAIPDFLLSTTQPPEKIELNELYNLSIEEYLNAIPYGAYSPLRQGQVKLDLLLKDRFIRFDFSEMIQNFVDVAIESLTSRIPALLGTFNSVLNEMKNILLGLVISIYFLVAKERMSALTSKLMHTVLPANALKGVNSFGRAAYLVFIEFMTGKLLDAVIVMYFTYIVLSVFGLPYPILLGSLIGLTNLIPFLGPIVGAIVSACIVFVFAPEKTIFFLLVIIAIQQLDLHLLEPHIIGPKQYLSNFWILISVVVMGRAFGVVGCFIAVPIFSVAAILLNSFLDRRFVADRDHATPDKEPNPNYET